MADIKRALAFAHDVDHCLIAQPAASPAIRAGRVDWRGTKQHETRGTSNDGTYGHATASRAGARRRATSAFASSNRRGLD